MGSAYANPISSAIHSFREVSDVIRENQEAPLRRELLAQEVADRRLNAERTRKTMEHEEKVRAQWERETGIKNITQDKIRELTDYLSADSELDAATKENRPPKLSDAQKKAVFGLLGDNPLFDPDKVDEQTDGIRTLRNFMRQNAPTLTKGGRLDLSQYPEIEKAANEVFELQLNRGGDQHGNTVDSGVKKRIKAAYIDPKDQTLVFALDVETPVREGQVLPPKGDQPPTYTVNPTAKGMTERGNIDIANRPAVRNADGSVSTVRSMGVNIDGKEVLIPTVSATGKMLTQEEAIAEYKKTGKHLGVFDSPEDATAYAEQLHSDQQQRYGHFAAPGQTSTHYEAPLTASRNGTDPNDPVLKIPVQMLDSYLGAHERLGTRIQQLRAEIDPKTYMQEIAQTKKNRASAAAREGALAKVDTNKPVSEQRKQFVIEYSRLNPDAKDSDVDAMAKLLIHDKETFGSDAGKQVADRARLVAQYGANSPEVKQFDATVEGKKEGSGVKETIYGPNGQTKVVFIAKGEDYTPPKGWSLKAPERANAIDEMRIATEVDKVEKLVVRDFRGEEGRAKGAESVDDLEYSISRVPYSEEDKEKVHAIIDRANALVRSGKSAAEAKIQAKKELPNPAKLAPLTEEIYKQVMSKKPKTRKQAEEEARKLGFDANRGYSPAKKAK